MDKEIAHPSIRREAGDRETQFPCPGCNDECSKTDLGGQLVRLSRAEALRVAFRLFTVVKVYRTRTCVKRQKQTPTSLGVVGAAQQRWMPPSGFLRLEGTLAVPTGCVQDNFVVIYGCVI